MTRAARRTAIVLAALVMSTSASTDVPWGSRGHEMATRAAVAMLPAELPAFFPAAVGQLVYLSPEPDRWRIRDHPEMARAWELDHYVDLENLPPGALEAPDRFAYLELLYAAGVSGRDAGLLYFRIVELYQRLVSQWERWAGEGSAERRRYIEARLIDDAGVLSHYVTDASQPQHTTIHFNGWAASAPNPEGFSEARNFHGRFETAFVDAHITVDEIRDRLPSAPESVAGDARAAVLDFIRASHAEVVPLYRLERDVGFEPRGSPDPRAEAFAADRLAAGARMLATLWWSAYREGVGG